MTGALLSQVVLDVAVVDPTAPASLQQFKSSEKWDVTAKARKRLTVKHFAEVYPAGIVNTRFCAMVFEASDRPGPSARDFIKHIMSEKWYKVMLEFHTKFSTVTARLGARLAMS